MSKIQMNEKILMQELMIRKVITIDDAINLLGVSESTVRRLFLRLEKTGACVRSHGSICALDNGFMNAYTYESAANTEAAKKETIAEKAIDLISNGDVIYLDTGTTVAKLAVRLANLLRDNKLSGLMIFTNSLMNLNILKDYTQVFVIGGEYRDSRKDFSGTLTEQMVRTVCYNKCFIGTDGYVKDVGFTAVDFQTAVVEQAVIANSKEKYILADSEKFNKRSVVCFAKESDITAIVTDDPGRVSFLAERNLRVL